MANRETMNDGVMIYPEAMPKAFQEKLDQVIENDPSATGEEAVTKVIFLMAADLALKEQQPEPILA